MKNETKNEHEKEFELVLLPGKCLPGGRYSELYEDVYSKWKETWTQIFAEVGSPGAFSADAFFRCDLIPVILHGQKIVAFYLATVYPLQPSWVKDHSYFSIFTKATSEKLVHRGVRNVMSYEFMTVLPEWRKSTLGFSLGAVLGELGLSIRDELNCDAAVGVARIQNKVDQIAHNIGGFTLEKEARRGNLVCEIVGFMKETDRTHPDRVAHNLTIDLWTKKTTIDITGNPRPSKAFRYAG